MRLVLMRHAEAAEGSADFTRPLTDAGRRQAKERGSQLADHRLELALVSDASRARETFEHLGLAIPVVSYDREIYFGSHETIIDMVRALPESAERVLIVGHEPTISQAATILGQTSPRVHEVRVGVPTATAIIVDFDEWSGPGDIVDVLR
ncbi:histidine phosphatase [Flaviflexus salsibiostraticola]|uniref:Histidine phosphatase n=1 Tax=Flaviflexus salsibiostraticola TaxID=1282737 RepID=A0A3Q8WSC6_9ACTO|nr:histidine phosphatase family protein [Flaviflexus salsibiostraticola]AZN29117.1 histidine phosphatase [Flaviflexus salsibiostraticola]